MVCVTSGAVLNAQSIDSNGGANVVVMVPNNVLFKSGGELFHYQGGQAYRVDRDLRISDRVTVRANGSVLKDGNVFTVGNGQMIFPDGRLETTPPGFAPAVAPD